MKKLVKGIAFVGAATTAGGSPPLGIAPKNSERRGHWGDLATSAIAHSSTTAKPLSTTTSPIKYPSETPAPARPGTPARPKASSSNFHLDLRFRSSVAFTFVTIIGCAVLLHLYRHTRNGTPAEIEMATITNTSNVFEHNLPLDTTQNNVLPHQQQVFNHIPTSTAPPLETGTRGVLVQSSSIPPSSNLDSRVLASSPPGPPPSPPLSPQPQIISSSPQQRVTGLAIASSAAEQQPPPQTQQRTQQREAAVSVALVFRQQ